MTDLHAYETVVNRRKIVGFKFDSTSYWVPILLEAIEGTETSLESWPWLVLALY